MIMMFLFISVIFLFALVVTPLSIVIVSLGERAAHDEIEPPLPYSAATLARRAGSRAN